MLAVLCTAECLVCLCYIHDGQDMYSCTTAVQQCIIVLATSRESQMNHRLALVYAGCRQELTVPIGTTHAMLSWLL